MNEPTPRIVFAHTDYCGMRCFIAECGFRDGDLVFGTDHLSVMLDSGTKETDLVVILEPRAIELLAAALAAHLRSIDREAAS